MRFKQKKQEKIGRPEYVNFIVLEPVKYGIIWNTIYPFSAAPITLAVTQPIKYLTVLFDSAFFHVY